MALEHIEIQAPHWRNAKSRAQWESSLRNYAQPIWDRLVDSITTDDVYNILHSIWSTKAETAKRVRGQIEAVLDAAKALQLRSGENPAAWRGNLSAILPRRRRSTQYHHTARPYREMANFMGRLTKSRSLSARALQFTILTAARTSEVLGARWDEIDLEKAIWTIPGRRMKVGKEHRVALSSSAVNLLRSLHHVGENVFPVFVAESTCRTCRWRMSCGA